MKRTLTYRTLWNICLGDIPRSIFYKTRISPANIKEIRFKAFMLGHKHYIQTPKMIKKGLKFHLPSKMYNKLKSDKKTLKTVIMLITNLQLGNERVIRIILSMLRGL